MAEGIMDRIRLQAVELGALQNEVKRRSMIYQCEAKERLALAAGLPLDTYYEYSFADWMDIKRHAEPA